jgi:hypothetical protein
MPHTDEFQPELDPDPPLYLVLAVLILQLCTDMVPLTSTWRCLYGMCALCYHCRQVDLSILMFGALMGYMSLFFTTYMFLSDILKD